MKSVHYLVWKCPETSPRGAIGVAIFSYQSLITPILNELDLQFIVYHCYVGKSPITHLVPGFTLIGSPGQKLCLLRNEVIS